MLASTVRFFDSIGDRQARMILTIMVLFCCALVGWAASIAGVPENPGMSGSLLSQSHPVWAMAFAGLSVLVCLLLSFGLARHGHKETGLFVGTIALVILAARGGPMRYVLFASPQAGIFLELAFELILLYAWVTLGWLLLQKLVPSDKKLDPIASGLTAMAIQAVVTAASVIFLAVSDQPAQALMAVGVGSIIGTIVAHMTFPLEGDIWFWMGPLITGVIGYLMAWHDPTGVLIGFPHSAMGPLARPIPLDYASAGPAGALIGLWTVRSWHNAEPES